LQKSIENYTKFKLYCHHVWERLQLAKINNKNFATENDSCAAK
jgi:hypothetical protein